MKMQPMRFVLLHHIDWPGHADHYDLMLQTARGDDDESTVLETYSSEEDELPDGIKQIAMRRVKPHRRMYLDYQGPVSGGRGLVRRIDVGELRNYGVDGEKNVSFEMFGRLFKGKYLISLNRSNQLVFMKIK